MAEINSNISLHLCQKCGEYKPRTIEYFVKDHGRLCSPCRVCRRLKHKEYSQSDSGRVTINCMRNKPANREKRRLQDMDYKQRNKDIISKKNSIRLKNYRLQRKLDVGFRINHRIRCRIRSCIRRGKQSLSLSRLDLGYTIDELKRHLERQFTKGMSWELFFSGKIHIDHIVPLSSFDLSDHAQIKSAWALSNLRPLWSHENLSKSAKRLYLL